MRSPLRSGIFFLLLGAMFVFLAVRAVEDSGWGFWAYFLILFATYDIGSGIRLILLHFRIKREVEKK